MFPCYTWNMKKKKCDAYRKKGLKGGSLMIERKKSLELKKHVAAIHSSNKLSLLQRKIANALLFNAYDELFEKNDHEIHIPTLCKLIGYDSNDHKTIKKALINLLSTVIEWNLVDGNKIDGDGIWNASSMIADASIEGSVCTYSYSNKMKKLLYRPELYGRLNMLIQAKFQSTYGLALYENCIRYQNIEQTPWFDLLTFRKLMGVEDGKYKIFRDFKNRVLKKAIEEVNEFSPVQIEALFQKQGRQVIAIQFLIKTVKQEKLKENLEFSLSKTLTHQFGLSKTQTENILTQYEEEYILEKISIVKNSPSYTKGIIKNLAKYLIAALKEDYQPIKKTKLIVDQVAKDKKQKSEGNRLEAYQRFRNKYLIQEFQKLTKKAKTMVLNNFEKFIKKGLYHSLYMKEGLSNLLIQDQLCRFMIENKLKILNKVPSYLVFCESKELEIF